MNDENQAIRETTYRPLVIHPGPSSIDDLLRHVDPAPDEETERFVAAIYDDRREAASAPRSE